MTVLSYTAKADVGGKLAQLGSRLIDGTAKKMADEFFENFRTAADRAGGRSPRLRRCLKPRWRLRRCARRRRPRASRGSRRTSSSGRPAAIVVLMLLVLLVPLSALFAGAGSSRQPVDGHRPLS